MIETRAARILELVPEVGRSGRQLIRLVHAELWNFDHLPVNMANHVGYGEFVCARCNVLEDVLNHRE